MIHQNSGVFISLFYQCLSVFICGSNRICHRPRECYIYSQHAGVNSGICAMRKLESLDPAACLFGCGLRWTRSILMATTGQTQKSPRTTAAPTPAKLSPDSERWVAQTLKKMTLDEKIGQVFAVGPMALLCPPKALTIATSFATSKKSISARSQFRRKARRSASCAAKCTRPRSWSTRCKAMPRFPCWSPRISNAAHPCASRKARRFPHAMAVAATGRPEDAYTMGKITAIEAQSSGRSVDFRARCRRQQQSR